MTDLVSQRRHTAWLILAVIMLALGGMYIVTQPFSAVMIESRIPISFLSPDQRQNIHQAVSRLNGVVIKPGEDFSFNGRVGERTAKRGFQGAPMYMHGKTVQSIGGGICVLSSVLYQMALSLNMAILERHAHDRPMQSVPPGLDATVWYDIPESQGDLKFKNTLDFPVQIKAESDAQALTVSIKGRHKNPLQRLLRHELHQGQHALTVEVFGVIPGQPRRAISRNTYRLTH